MLFSNLLPVPAAIIRFLPDEVGEGCCCRTVQSWLWFARLEMRRLPCSGARCGEAGTVPFRPLLLLNPAGCRAHTKTPPPGHPTRELSDKSRLRVFEGGLMLRRTNNPRSGECTLRTPAAFTQVKRGSRFRLDRMPSIREYSQLCRGLLRSRFGSCGGVP